MVLALKTKKENKTKGKIEFIAHCNEIRIKGELFFFEEKIASKAGKHLQKGRYVPTNISYSLMAYLISMSEFQ